MVWMQVVILVAFGCLKPIAEASSDLLMRYPWIGSLSFQETPGLKHHCNTIMVNQTLFLTAARCVLIEPQLSTEFQIPWRKYPAFIVMGVDDYLDSCNADFQKVPVLDAWVHWNAKFGQKFPFENKFDVALVVTEKPMRTAYNIKPVTLPSFPDEDYRSHLIDNPSCIAIGWELDPSRFELSSRFPANKSILESYPVKFMDIDVGCHTFLDGEYLQSCKQHMALMKSEVLVADGGLAEGAAGAPVFCTIGAAPTMFAMITGSISSCFYYHCNPKNSELKPTVVGAVGVVVVDFYITEARKSDAEESSE